MTSSIDHLLRELKSAGAVLGSDVGSDAFRQLTYTLDRVVVQLTSEYGNWLVNIGLDQRPLAPASFWIAALDGAEAYPPVTAEDLERLAERLPELLERSQQLVDRVAVLGRQYSGDMRSRLS